MRQRWFVLAVLIVLIAVLPLTAQRGGGRRRGYFGGYVPIPTAHAYDGKFAIVRLWYDNYPGWSYDYPDMEQNLNLILPELTAIAVSPTGGNILKMDDPELMKFPLAYLSEPGYWYPTDSEVKGLRTYIEKGGFIIIDDFHYPEEWNVFEVAITRVLPKARIVRLDVTHPIFNTFFALKSLEVPYPGRPGLIGEFFGIYENNDPTKRLSVVINYNMDMGNYMEHSAEGLYAVDQTNEAYKFGINYMLYGMSR